jgi:hypothetical protein
VTKRRSASPSRIGGLLTSLGLELDDHARRAFLHAGTRAAALATLAIFVGVGLVALERRVHGRVESRPLNLQWERLPDWLAPPSNGHILAELEARLAPALGDRLLDRELPRRVAAVLSGPGAEWVKSVERVRVGPDGVVHLHCAFRRPAAWVSCGGYCYLVDDQQVRLPGVYARDQCDGGALLILTGVASPPPPVGCVWTGADLVAGLKLSAMLHDRPFRNQIRSVTLANYDGRRNRSLPHIELLTDRDGARVWWGRPPDEERGTEITADQKLILLDTIYRKWGRIDMNRGYVNIMTWPDRVATPAILRGDAGEGRVLRG